MENENQMLTDMQGDYKSAEKMKNDNDAYVVDSIAIYDSQPYGNEKRFKSRYVSSMVKQNVNWQVPSIVAPFTSSEGIITVEPAGPSDVETARQAELLLNYQFSRDFNRFQFISDLVIKLAVEGTCFVKTSWEFEEKEVTEIIEKRVPVPMEPMVEQAFMESMQQAMMQAQQNGQDPQEVQDMFMQQIPTQIVEEEHTYMKTIKNKPTAEICELVDIRVDPTCRGEINKAQFIIHDFETDLSTLKKDGRYKNLDQLEHMLERDETYIPRDNVDDTFKFSDEARKRFIAHEYWGNYDINGDGIAEPVVVVWVGDVIIREDPNPLDDGRLPFQRAVYGRRPGYIYGESLCTLIGDKQRIDSVLNRGIFDDMKAANNGQRGTKKNFTDEANMLKFKKGEDFEYNSSMADVWEGKYTPISPSIFSVIEKNRSEADAMSGIKSFDHGRGGDSLGTTAAAVNATTSSSAKREMQIIRGIAEDCIIPMLQTWLAYDALFLEEEEVIRITESEFATINRDDLEGNIDIKMSIETQEAKAMKADRLAFLMQTMGNNMPAEQSNIIMGDLMDINDMPSLGEALRNMPPPQPSPQEQEVMALKIELLKAQVQNEYAKARENEIDYELKSAKTQNELAKARNLDSKSDTQDLDFLMKEDGIDHEREVQKIAIKGDQDRENTRTKELSKITQERMKQEAAKNNKNDL